MGEQSAMRHVPAPEQGWRGYEDQLRRHWIPDQSLSLTFVIEDRGL